MTAVFSDELRARVEAALLKAHKLRPPRAP